MIEGYLSDRYGSNVKVNWDDYLNNNQLTEHYTEYGFVTYKLQGDAVMIYDMYIKPENRSSKHAWELHNHVMDRAEEEQKRVALTFSDFLGQNHKLGFQAMCAAGFIPAYKTNHQFVFLKGI